MALLIATRSTQASKCWPVRIPKSDPKPSWLLKAAMMFSQLEFVWKLKVETSKSWFNLEKRQRTLLDGHFGGGRVSTTFGLSLIYASYPMTISWNRNPSEASVKKFPGHYATMPWPTLDSRSIIPFGASPWLEHSARFQWNPRRIAGVSSHSADTGG